MISSVGNWLQVLVMLLAISSIIYRKYSTFLLYITCLATLLLFITLVTAFVISDFSVQNVFFNSSTIKPIIFKIAGSWASHEGSMVLLLCLLGIVSTLFVFLSTEQTILYIETAILSWVLLLFSSFIYFTSNPFVALSFKPKEGLGLNPLLQDIALAIHPPILYLGYICFVVPFTIACIVLLKPGLQLNVLKLAKIFSTAGILFLTMGIALGSWWAYRELGWGGYWFFDPVENISLMPWLSGIALHHSFLVSVKTGRLIKWTISLSIITFLLSILGLFLVRSGMITSVHSFASSPERATYILALFSLIALPSLYLLFWRGHRLKWDQTLSITESGIVAGNILWLIALIVIIIATIYPIIFSLVFNQTISVSQNYFLNIFLPVVIPTIFVAGIIPDFKMNKVSFTIILVSTALILFLSLQMPIGFKSAFALILSLFLFLQNIYALFYKTNFFKTRLYVSSAARIISHIGFALLVFSITINSSVQSETEFIGKIGKVIEFNEFSIKLHDVKFAQSQSYYRQIAEFWVHNNNEDKTTILKPENRLYKVEQTLSEESDISSFLTYDLYAVLSRIDDNIVHAKIYYRPMISFVWISALIMCSGFFISLIRRRQ